MKYGKTLQNIIKIICESTEENILLNLKMINFNKDEFYIISIIFEFI